MIAAAALLLSVLLEARPVFLFNQSLYFGSFTRPRAIAYDREHDELWLVDAGRIGIHKPDGTELFSFTSKEHLQDPALLAVAPKGKVAVVDGARTKLRLFNYRGEYAGDAALQDLGERPLIGAVAYDARGQLYVAENRSGQVFVYRPDGSLKFTFGSHGTDEGQFTAVCAIAIGTDGTIHVVDQRALAVQLFDHEGNFLRGWGKHEMGAQNFSLPSAIAVDSKGRILVTDELRQQVKVFSPDGKLLTVFGGLGDGPGQLSFPTGIAVDAQDRIFVSERMTARVQVFELVERDRER